MTEARPRASVAFTAIWITSPLPTDDGLGLAETNGGVPSRTVAKTVSGTLVLSALSYAVATVSSSGETVPPGATTRAVTVTLSPAGSRLNVVSFVNAPENSSCIRSTLASSLASIVYVSVSPSNTVSGATENARIRGRSPWPKPPSGRSQAATAVSVARARIGTAARTR